MSESNPPPVDPRLIARVKGILLDPQTEWAVIDDEFATVESLLKGYAVPLAAIGPIAGLIGGVLTGGSVLGLLIGAILGYVLALVVVFLLSLIIDALASSFGGVPDRVRATKTAVYASTGAWVAGVANIVPILGGIIALLGALYSIYLMYLGLGRVMKAPSDKTVVYTVVVVIAYVVAAMIAALLVAAVVAMTIGGAAGMAAISSL